MRPRHLLVCSSRGSVFPSLASCHIALAHMSRIFFFKKQTKTNQLSHSSPHASEWVEPIGLRPNLGRCSRNHQRSDAQRRRRKTLTHRWDAREREIRSSWRKRVITNRKNLGTSGRAREGFESDQVIQNCIDTFAELALDANGELWIKEVSDAARIAEQSRNEEDLERVAELWVWASQLIVGEVF